MGPALNRADDQAGPDRHWCVGALQKTPAGVESSPRCPAEKTPEGAVIPRPAPSGPDATSSVNHRAVADGARSGDPGASVGGEADFAPGPRLTCELCGTADCWDGFDVCAAGGSWDGGWR